VLGRESASFILCRFFITTGIFILFAFGLFDTVNAQDCSSPDYTKLTVELLSNKRNAMSCIKHSGFVGFKIQNGRLPIQIEITSMPDDYTGKTITYIEEKDRPIYQILGNAWENLVAGDYIFTYSDGCTSIEIPVTVDLIDDDFPSDPLASHFIQPDCSNKAYVEINTNEKHQYWGLGRRTFSEDSYYEIAFMFDDDKPKETDWKIVPAPHLYEITRFEITFDEPYKDLYEKDAKVKVYLRIKKAICETEKGIETCYRREEDIVCERLVDTVKFSEPYIVPFPEIQDKIRLCQSNETTTLSAKPLNSNHSIQWYDENETLLSASPKIVHNIEQDYVFYVAQTDKSQNCSSDKKKVQVRVTPLPEKSARVTGRSCESVNLKITVSDIVAGYEYTVFSDAESNIPVMTFEGEGETMTLPLGTSVNNTTFYLQTAIKGGCALAPVAFQVEANKPELLPEKLPTYIPGEPYSVQLTSDAQEPSFVSDITVPGISMTADRLISGTVPESEGGKEWTFTVTVTDKAVPNSCATAREYLLRTCDPAPEVAQSELKYCEGDRSAALTALPLSGRSLQWYRGDEKLSGAPSPNTSLVGEQVFYVSQINAGLQCESAKSKITVTVTPSPTLDFEAPDGNICFGSSSLIRMANLNIEYVYDIYSDAQTTNKITSVTGKESEEVAFSIVPETSISYYILVTGSRNCTAGPVEVKVNVSNPAILPAKLPVYEHDVPYTVQLETNAQDPVFSYEGVLVTGISMTPEGLISGTVPASAGREESAFTVSTTGSDGCEALREYVLRPCEPAPDLPEDTIVYCPYAQASPLQASSPNGNIIQWYDSGMNALDAAPVPATAIPGKQIFYVSQINETLQCEGPKAQVTVLVNAAPAIDFNVSADSVCAGSSPVIKLENIRQNYIYSVYPDNTFSEILASLTAVNPETVETVNLDNTIEDNTVYYLTVTDDAGCTSTDWAEIAVKVIKLYIEPEKLMHYQKNTEYEQKLFTNAQSPVFTVVNGSLPEGLTLNSSGTLYGNVPPNEHSTSNVFTVEVLDSNGCRVLQEYTLYGNVFVPKLFTPNGDGVNDVFMQDYKVVIFDRLGIEIFKGDNGWDGTHNGKIVAPGIYFFILKYLNENGDNNILTGYIGIHY
jgi:gliding motility-associated-like protein